MAGTMDIVWLRRIKSPGAETLAILFGLGSFSRGIASAVLPINTVRFLGSDEAVSLCMLAGSLVAIPTVIAAPSLARRFGRAGLTRPWLLFRPDRQGYKTRRFANWKRAMSETPKTDAGFFQRLSIEQVEEGFDLAPKFDANDLIPVVTTAAEDGEVLMVGYMNAEAMHKTIETSEAHYFSRSRQQVWHKGATSGLVQKIVEMRIDDDQDSVWLKVAVQGSGASCHVGYRSCFYRAVSTGSPDGATQPLAFVEHEKTFDPVKVYGDAPNPTKL